MSSGATSSRPRATARPTAPYANGPANMAGKMVRMSMRMWLVIGQQAGQRLDLQHACRRVDGRHDVADGGDEHLAGVATHHVDIVGAGGEDLHDSAQRAAAGRDGA